MKRILILLIISINLLVGNAQQLVLSDSSQVSLITCSPGKEVYAAFGHTAIRVKDPTKNIDVVFNYGIFSFNTENFYYKFIKGETDYQLGVFDTNIFLPEYAARNSMVWEQVLNLQPDEKRDLLDALIENYKPENRVYRYNFIFDNCSTRPRDKIWEVLNGYVKSDGVTLKHTFRQWVGQYTGEDNWLKFGIDLIFGLDADKIATEKESMFLPEILMNETQYSKIVDPHGKERKLVLKSQVLVNKTEEPTHQAKWYQKPLNITLLILLLGGIITAWDIKKKKHNKIFDTLLMASSGLAGCIVFYLMFLSVHPMVKNNLNILWLNPLNLAVAVIIWIKPLRKIRLYYQLANAILLGISLLVFAIAIQKIEIAAFPLIVLLFIRSIGWLAYVKRKTSRKRDVYLRRK